MGRDENAKSAPNGRKNRKNEGMRVRIHPLFLIVGGLYCILGDLPAFLLSTTVALQHECAHAIAAAKLGYRLDRIVLMPYGAVIDGDLSGLGFKDEAFVALAGPVCNLLTALSFVALWWLFPVAYPYTDSAVYVSLSIALVNLIPAYPLDGGRVLRAALCVQVGERRADRICKATAFVLSSLFLLANVLLWTDGKFSLGYLVFTLFLLTGCFGNGKGKQSAYIKIDYSNKAAFLRGVEIKRVAVADVCTLRRAVNFTERGKYLVLDVYDARERFVGSVTQNELAEIFYAGSPNDRLGDRLIGLRGVGGNGGSDGLRGVDGLRDSAVKEKDKNVKNAFFYGRDGEKGLQKT